MVIAIGCTGGQHRSVALAKRLAEYLNEILNIMFMCIIEMRILKVEEIMKQMNVVLIGGGTGLSVLARGLREFQ